MVQMDALVMEVDANAPFVWVTFAAPDVAAELAAGRFALAALGDYLRAPLFPARIEPERGTFEFWASPDHPAAGLRVGERVNLLGPLGRGYEIPPDSRRLLLIADGLHLPMLLPLLEPGWPGERATALFLADSPASYPIQLLPPSLEIHIAAAGRSISDLSPDLLRWADVICAAAEPSLYPVLAHALREARPGAGRRFAQALVIPPMACGVGACQGCAVKTARGFRLACADGPVFDLLELE